MKKKPDAAKKTIYWYLFEVWFWQGFHYNPSIDLINDFKLLYSYTLYFHIKSRSHP